MKKITYKVIKYPDGFEAECNQYPYITWIADTKDEALEGAQESAFMWLCYEEEKLEVTFRNSQIKVFFDRKS